ncbi:MAG: ferredoxin-thioredoxin reductase catalytic domain-containing protein [Thermoplasmatota archaeon]
MRDKEEMMEYVKKDAEEHGYYICPDDSLLKDLIEGLVENEKRYGYGSCPCRQASGIKQYDVDIICPCEYRDADVNEFGMCYCGLFVSKEVKDDPEKLEPIPERRPQEIIEAGIDAKVKKEEQTEEPKGEETTGSKEDIKIYRCTVCGYLAARDTPPPVCPICKAKAERFKEFKIQ